MRRRVKKIMAFLLAFALVMSAAGSGKLTVLAETSAQETAVETQSQSAVQNTDLQGGSGSSGQPEQPLEEEVQTGNTGTENTNNGNVSSEQNGQTASVPESSSSVEPSSSESGMTGSSETGATESSSGSESTSESESTTESASESESTTESASETESVTQTEEISEEETTETETETEEETTETETETLTEEEGDGAETMEYTPESQPEGIHVWAYAKEGTFPEGTKMLVSRLDGSAKEEAGAKLDENGVEYDGFFALDISFEGPDGNKIEPEEGSVEVRFEVDASFLPEEADTDSLEVQHLDESGDSTNVETVATAAEGSVSVNSDKVKAAFAVESFSTFTITWSEEGLLWETTYFNVTVHYVDENGNEIEDGWRQDIQIENVSNWEDETFEFEDYASPIFEYEYLEARFSQSGFSNAQKVVQMVASQSGSHYGTTRILRFYNSQDASKGSLIAEMKSERQTQTADIYLVYQKTGGGSGKPEPADSTPEYKKYVAAREDGTYDLTLTVKGDMDTTSVTPQMDVIFVLDTSGSMAYDMNDESGRSGERRTAANNAITSLVNELAGNGEIDTRFALVTFATGEDVEQGWTSSAQEIRRSLPGSSDGGTNWHGGILETKDLLRNSRSDSIKVVIFVSDGEPTYYYNQYGTLKGAGDVDADGSILGYPTSNPGACSNAAYNEIRDMQAHYFYTIGVGPASNYGKLKYLADNAASVGTKGFYEGTDASSLTEAFEDIREQITEYKFSGVSIEDTLSSNVDIVAGSELTITVLNENGNVVNKGTNSITLSDGTTITVSRNGKQIRLNFPENYELEDGWTYQVTVNIEPTQEAYEAYRQNGNTYPNTGDSNTDAPGVQEGNYISSGKQGVYNTKATLTYTYNGKEHSKEYPMPVIPLKLGTLVIEKTIRGLEADSEALPYLIENLRFIWGLSNTESSSILLKDFEQQSGETELTYTWKAEGLAPGSYQVSEENADILAEFNLTLDEDQSCTEAQTITVQEGETAKVQFTNVYKPSEQILTVTKVVKGNMGDSDEDFSFKLKLEKSAGEAYQEKIFVKRDKGTDWEDLTVGLDGSYSFTLKDTEGIQIRIPYGYHYTISEVLEEYSGYVVDIKYIDGNGSETTGDSSLSGDLTSDLSVTFTNTKNIAPPTGLNGNTAPFAAMLLTAAAGSLWFGFIGRRKRSA